MSAVESETAVGRKLGHYLKCPPEAIVAALKRQVEAPADGERRRIGELLVEAGALTEEALAAGVEAQRVDRLASCPLFWELSREELVTLASAFEEVSVGVSRQFITQDEHDPTLFILASGRLEVFRTEEEGEMHLAVLHPGEPIGEMGYFSDGIRTASVRALDHSQLVRAPYSEITRLFETVPNVARAFMSVVTDRLRKTNELYQENRYTGPAKRSGLSHLGGMLDPDEAEKHRSVMEDHVERLVLTASRLTDADRATLFLIDRETGELWSMVAEGAEVREIRIPAGSGLAGWVAENGELLNVEDAYEDPRFNPEVDKKTGYRTVTVLCVPVRGVEGDVVGVVQVINKNLGLFTEDDENMLFAFSEQAAVALESLDLHHRITRSYRRLASVLDVATAVGAAPDMGSLMKNVGLRCAEQLDCEQVEMFLLDREAEEVWTLREGTSGFDELRLPVSGSLTGRAADKGQVMQVEDARQDERYNPDLDRKLGYRSRSVLCVPLRNARDEIIGAFRATNQKEGRFGERALETLRAISAQVGMSHLLNR